MNSDIALFLAQDGITTAAIYSLLAISLILVFTVTRIIYVPQGEFISFGALTLANIQQGNLPRSIYVVVALGALALVYEIFDAFKHRQRPNAVNLVLFLIYPAAVWALVSNLDLKDSSIIVQLVVTFAIVIPIGPMLYRIVFQPIADAKVLVLLIAAVATQLVLVGLGLLTFGPEGSRTQSFSDFSFRMGPLTISGQSVATMVLCVALIASLAWLLTSTLYGKSLRATAVNRRGARIVGISPQMSGQICFVIAAAVGTLSGILISPIATIYYDSGFLIGLKGFVAAIIGGLASYPIAAFGALFLGMTESFVSFWTSAFKEVVVFGLLIPVLLARSLTSRVLLDDQE
jgi:branched-chain amino acid transport system permease protein